MRSSCFYLLLIAVFLFGLEGMAQNSLWDQVQSEKLVNKDFVVRNSTPASFEVYKLKDSSFKRKLQEAPNHYSIGSNTIIDLPVVDGKTQRFEVFNAPVMAQQLQNKYPSIHSYIAQGVDDPTAVARISVSN